MHQLIDYLRRLPAAWLASVLLFAYPLFLVSVNHWASAIYLSLSLLALACLRRPESPLTRDEWIIIGVIVFFMTATILANTFSGWTRASVRWFEADSRFLLAIPIFMLLRRHPETAMYLFRAVPVAGIFAGLYVIHGTLTSEERFYGPYGPIFIGNISALLAAISMVTMRSAVWPGRIGIPLHLAGVVLALVAVALSGSRSAWLAIALVLPVAIFLVLRGMPAGPLRKWLAIGLTAMIGVTLVFSTFLDPRLTQQRLSQAVEQVEDFIGAETDEQRSAAADSSIGIRLEQWRAGWMIFRENPVFGVGVGNVSHRINDLVAAGILSPAIEVHDADEGRGSHLHSAYFDTLAFKGMVGMAALLCLFLVPVYLALRPEYRGTAAADVILVHVLAFLVFSATEDPFIRNNFSSVYLMFLVGALTMMFHRHEQITR